jgi:hypothetical protein
MLGDMEARRRHPRDSRVQCTHHLRTTFVRTRCWPWIKKQVRSIFRTAQIEQSAVVRSIIRDRYILPRQATVSYLPAQYYA